MPDLFKDFSQRFKEDEDFKRKAKAIGLCVILFIFLGVGYSQLNKEDIPVANKEQGNRIENYVQSDSINYVGEKPTYYENDKEVSDLNIPRSNQSQDNSEDDLDLESYSRNRQQSLSQMNSVPPTRRYNPSPPIERRSIPSSPTRTYSDPISEPVYEERTPQIVSPPSKPTNDDKYPTLPDEIIVTIEPYSRVKNGQDALAYVFEEFKIKGTTIPKNTPIKGKITFAGGRIQYNPRVIITPQKSFYCNYLAYSRDGDLGFSAAEEIPEELMMNNVKNEAVNGIKTPDVGVFSNTVESVANAFKTLATRSDSRYIKTSGIAKILILRKPFIDF